MTSPITCTAVTSSASRPRIRTRACIRFACNSRTRGIQPSSQEAGIGPRVQSNFLQLEWVGRPTLGRRLNRLAVCIEHFPHLGDQGCEAERFFQKPKSFVEDAIVH